MQKENFHIIGLGGIGMSAIARLLKQKGCHVSGEDQNKSHLVELLQKEGVKLAPDYSKNPTIVYSTAIKENHPTMTLAKKKNLKIEHRAALLNRLLKEKKGLLVAGTHGKTTTSALLSHVLLELGKDPSFAVGGILKGLSTNAKVGKGEYFVAEADESDGSFLNFEKYGAILTNIEEEHLDYWKTKEKLIEGFLTFVKETKHLVYCKDDPILSSLNLKGISYGLSSNADVYCKDLLVEKENLIFSLQTKNGLYEKVMLPLMGKHNLLNALGVIALLSSLGFKEIEIIKALASFQGIKRRLDVVYNSEELLLIDDYAHHPTEVEVVLKALEPLTEKRRLVAVFQPHRPSRFKRFLEEFVQSLSLADKVVVTDIYKAAESEDISLDDFVKKVGQDRCVYVPRQDLEKYLESYLSVFDVAITLGAGDITNVFTRLKKKKSSIALLFGGPSLENSISIQSAKTFYKGLLKPFYTPILFYLDTNRNWHESSSFDLENKTPITTPALVEKLLSCAAVIPSFHGPFGEDGVIQGFLTTLNIPYTSAPPLACALAMHKGLAKRVVASLGIQTAKFIELKRHFFSYENLLESVQGFSFPLFIKPASLGSSFGVFEIAQKKDLFPLIEKAFTFSDHLLLEEKIHGEEIEVGLMGDNKIEVGLLAKIPVKGSMHTFETKYGKNAPSSEIPAHISDSLEEELVSQACRIYRAFQFTSHVRIDFFVRDKEVFFNEINPIPGMTSNSAFPIMFEKKGISLDKLVGDLISIAIKRKS